MEFKNDIRSNKPTNVVAGGGIHPLTKYVMNYIKALIDYAETLDVLLQDLYVNDLSQESRAIVGSFQNSTPVICYLLSITSIFESNLEGFRTSLSSLEMNGSRSTVLLSIRNTMIWCTSRKTVLYESIKKFNLVFEEIYKSQTAWVIPSVQLRVELRISLSLNVLQYYRGLVRFSRYLDNVRQKDKYIKYSPEDLEEFLQDLFEGCPKSLRSLGRKKN
ncbi:exocyst complex component EXO70E2-like [Dioscorea cayenensis subsp. rotundata]|uniref:Exocyst subunit Exo70 family protein n=1 Tax=Dioscorea cayennensis subsp. rotundata TaxID=55577 RepID=A0AB40AK71_DIOCR|nr:exocyst complex component EXO70E2-like [Dioscorea cayenensis subsp. rotundata]